MHAELVTDAQGQVFSWVVDAPVGLNGVNNFDDVLFVQWCFYKMSKWDRVPAELRAIFAQTPISGDCTGREGDLLIASIKAFQKSPLMNSLVDGRVSPAQGKATYKDHHAKHVFIIYRLNAALRLIHPQQYPRLDLMPEFIWRIKAKITGPFI